jgi:N6-L-threonylcarbamoyladenine synthase
MIVLGIETSCDDTAVALVDHERRILAEAVRGQHDAHAPFGGVVPEIAARAHSQILDRLIDQVRREVGAGFGDLDGIAASAGPGLIGGLIVGLITAKAIALVHRKPLIAVNHLEGHALTPRLTEGLAFPYLLLLVSGGHCQLLLVRGVGHYRRLGTTLDDALGEAFDKVAKMLGLGFPGGPAVERAAAEGDPGAFPLPRPMVGQPGCHFSFSGLKTAVRQTIDRLGTDRLSTAARSDLCASFQAAATDSVVDRVGRAMAMVRRDLGGEPVLVVAGGVAANQHLARRLDRLAGDNGYRLVVPPARLCTDNGAIIAWVGHERLARGDTDPFDAPARARWPLDPAAEPALGAGIKA